MTTPASEKPYKKYRASRVGRPHADGDALGVADKPRTRRATKPAPGDGSPTAEAILGQPRTDVGDQPAGTRSRDGNGAAGADLQAVPGSQPHPRRRVVRWVLLGTLLVVIVLAAVAGVWAYRGYHTFDKAVTKSNRRVDKSTKAALVPDTGSLLSASSTILIIGTDARDAGPARSDTIMLMRSDPHTHSMSTLSIPRDTLVPVDGHGQTKINEAFFWGGGPLAIRTISGFTGIPINHIMIVDFRGFPRLIDSVGGVTVDVPADISSWYSGDITVHFKKGPQHMNGKTALIYSRIRKVDSDFMRMGRQQQVVQALEKKLTRPGNLIHLPVIGADFMRGVATDLKTRQLIELAYLQWRAKPAHRYRFILQGTPAMVGGASVVLADAGANQKLIKQFLSR